MITVITQLKAKNGERFNNELLALVAPTRSVEGCIGYVILPLEGPFFHQFSTLHGFTRYLDPLNTNIYIVVDFKNIMMI